MSPTSGGSQVEGIDMKSPRTISTIFLRNEREQAESGSWPMKTDNSEPWTRVSYRIDSMSEKRAIGMLAPAKLEKPMNHMM
jgi:hypothetical protein